MMLLDILKLDFVSSKRKFCSDFDFDAVERFSVIKILLHIAVPSFGLVFWFRVYSYLYRRGGTVCNFLYRIIYFSVIKRYSCDIHPAATIGYPLKIGHPMNIVIGPTVEIGSNCYIFNGVTLGNKYVGEADAMPKVGDNVIIGTNAKVLGAVYIGTGAIIGAQSLILTDVASNQIAYGIPYMPKNCNV